MSKRYTLFSLLIIAISCRPIHNNFTKVTWVQSCDQSIDVVKGDTTCVEYYENDLLMRKTLYEGGEGRSAQKDLYFDTNGREIANEFRSMGISERTEMFLDKLGQVIKVVSYDLNKPSDTTKFIWVYTTESDSQVSVAKMYYQDTILKSIVTSHYFSGNLISDVRTLTIDGDSTIAESIDRYTYDINRNKLSHTVKNSDGSIVQEIYTYNSSKKVASEKLLKNNTLIYELKFYYNNGLKDHASISFPDKRSCTIKFVYSG